ncbi:hypothetical protein ABT084_36270 [Streptomyces sp. NPDC002138]|uniref:hypothetical protein n=1 Tax=Streptomyces sp. NPDC002138 TaxID=3154410 RepID=UPI003324E438
MTSLSPNSQSTPVLSEEFQERWVRRGESLKRRSPFIPALPVILEGERVDDIERMNLEYPGDLYVTPMVHRSTLALAAFVDAKEMLRKAREVTEDGELRKLLRGHALGCIADGDPVRLVLDCYDNQNLEGSKLRLDPEAMCPDLSRIQRGFSYQHLNWDNAIRSVDACAYPYSVSSDPWFHGITHFINFRCSFNATSFGYTGSSVRNWGTLPPDY